MRLRVDPCVDSTGRYSNRDLRLKAFSTAVEFTHIQKAFDGFSIEQNPQCTRVLFLSSLNKHFTLLMRRCVHCSTDLGGVYLWSLVFRYSVCYCDYFWPANTECWLFLYQKYTTNIWHDMIISCMFCYFSYYKQIWVMAYETTFCDSHNYMEKLLAARGFTRISFYPGWKYPIK